MNVIVSLPRVHLPALDVEAVEAVTTDREPIDVPQEDVLVTANTSMSCGADLYAYRADPTLFRVRCGGATLIASEPLDDDARSELPDGVLQICTPDAIARAA